jgi:predicted amidohydrolase YtcJ
MLKLLGSAFVTALTVAAPGIAFQASAPATADTILIHGNFITLDDADSIAEAIAIRNGRILAVGSSAEIMKRAVSRTRVIDLHGAAATPGLIDSHLHFAGVDPIYSIDLSRVNSIEEALRLVSARAAKSKPGEWIQGEGWDEGKLAEHRYLYAADLDRVSPNNPVWLMHTTGHYGVANSAALRLANITASTRNPPAGTIDRGPDRQPTGVLKEDAAMRMITQLIPPYSRQQLRDGYLTTMSKLNAEGITAIKDPGITEENWSVYAQLRDEHQLTVHLFALWRGETTVAQTQSAIEKIQALPASLRVNSKSEDDTLVAGGIKLFMDGSGGARTAWMHTDWNKNFTAIDDGNRGYPVTDPEIYRQQVRLIHNAGIHVGTHAIGDQAIDWVLDTYAAVLKDHPVRGLRHSVIHANIPTGHAIETMAFLERQYDAGYPEAQPEFMYWIGDTYAGNFGAARCLRLMPLHSYLSHGIKWAGGSDYPVTPFPPRLGLWASISRETLNGTYGKRPFGMAESVNIHDAMRSYTSWGARQLFLEDRIGSIETGKDADIAVWDRNPYTISVPEIKDMKCTMTFFRGKLVYEAKP